MRTSLSTALGHSLRDIGLFSPINEDSPSPDKLGENILEALWGNSEDRHSLIDTLFIDLLFESEKNNELLGFLALNKRCCPQGSCDNGISPIEAYKNVLNNLFKSHESVGSHDEFRSGLINDNNNDEDFLHYNLNLSIMPKIESDKWGDHFEIEPASLLSEPDLVDFRKKVSKKSVNDNWKAFAKEFESQFSNQGLQEATPHKVILFGVPIVTHDKKRDEVARGALFFGQIVNSSAN